MTKLGANLLFSALRSIVKKHGGRIVSDGCGGFEVLAPPDRKWIDAEVQCYVLPLSEYEPHERPDEIQRCIDLVENGHMPYGD